MTRPIIADLAKKADAALCEIADAMQAAEEFLAVTDTDRHRLKHLVELELERAKGLLFGSVRQAHAALIAIGRGEAVD